MAYGANPALANGEGDFPSDLPASLLVSVDSSQSVFGYGIAGPVITVISAHFLC